MTAMPFTSGTDFDSSPLAADPLAIAGFKPLTIDDRPIITAFLRRNPPRISELTFTNLFIWRQHYRPFWTVVDDCLLVVTSPMDAEPFGFPPIGTGDVPQALDRLFTVLDILGPNPGLSRVDRTFIGRYIDPDRFRVEPDRNQADYVYLTADLIALNGRKFHQRRNHFNYFLKNYDFECHPIEAEIVPAVLDLQDDWCRVRQCAEDPFLAGEHRAVYEALTHFGRLDYRGLAVTIGGRIEAFALGEPLNHDTVVIHIEKANPEIRGLYAAINQRFCQEMWSEYQFVNREQDLGLEGLRQAKRAYNPAHMVDKFRVYRS